MRALAPNKLEAPTSISIISTHIPASPCTNKLLHQAPPWFLFLLHARSTHTARWNFLPKQSDSFIYIGCSHCCFWCSAHTHRGTIKHIYTEDASNAHTHTHIWRSLCFFGRASAQQVGSGAFEVTRPPPLALPAAADIGSSGCSD